MVLLLVQAWGLRRVLFDEMLNSFGVRVDTRTTEEKFTELQEAAVMAGREGIGQGFEYIGYV